MTINATDVANEIACLATDMEHEIIDLREKGSGQSSKYNTAMGLLHEVMGFIYMDDEVPEETVKAIEKFLSGKQG